MCECELVFDLIQRTRLILLDFHVLFAFLLSQCLSNSFSEIQRILIFLIFETGWRAPFNLYTHQSQLTQIKSLGLTTIKIELETFRERERVLLQQMLILGRVSICS